MTPVVGVDGGGTSTRAVILAPDGVEIGRAEGPASVVTGSSPDASVRAVTETVRAAALLAGVALPARAMWAGLAGAGRGDARETVAELLGRSGLAEAVHVGTDAEAAHFHAFRGGAGVLLIAGTGSIAWGRGEDGALVRVGGWGTKLGDEGSGYSIGMRALRDVMRAHDGRGERTDLSGPVLERCGVAEPPELVGWVEGAPKSEVASLVPIVSEAAARADTVAQAIVRGAVEALVEHLNAILQGPGPPGQRARLVLWGGLLAADGPLRAPLLDAIDALQVDVLDRPVDPPMGAALLARRMLHAGG